MPFLIWLLFCCNLHGEAQVSSDVRCVKSLCKYPFECPYHLFYPCYLSCRFRLDETLCARLLLNARTFLDLRRAAQIYGNPVLDWRCIEPLLEPPPGVLLQTYQADHEPAANNKARFAPHLRRVLVNDDQCEEDIQAFGGQRLLQLYRSYDKGAHRADMWRYIKLFLEGGHYLDIKCALYRPWNETMDAISQQGTAQLAVQGTAQHRGQGTAQPLIMAIGRDKDHIFQGIILNCPKNHPLLLRAIKHCMQTTSQELTGTGYMRFCKHLFALLTEDLGREPQPGWSQCSQYGPIYLMHETKERKMNNFADSAGNRFHVDGHMMYAGTTLFAATRAWKWQHGFKSSDLQVQVINAAAEAAQLDQGTAQSIAAKLDESTGQSSSPAAVSTGAAEVMPLDTELPTADECTGLIQLLESSSWYQGLGTREIMQLFVLGLREHPTSQGWVGCKHCKNASRKPIHFSNVESLRKHFEEKHLQEPATASHEEEQHTPPTANNDEAVGNELRGVWADAEPDWAKADIKDRLAAASKPAPAVPMADLLLSELRQAEGHVGRFIQRVVQVLQARDAGHGQALQTAFQQLGIVPDILCPSFWRTKTKKHLTWSGLTQVEVLGDGKIKLWSWDSERWAWVEATVQDTAITGAMMSLFIDGMTEVAENCSLDLPKRQAASLSTAVLFNEACLKHSQQQRLLVQKDGFSLKYEHTPGRADFKYTSRKRNLTNTQAQTNMLQGRRKREEYAD